jgi:hypothetical protein
MSSLTDLLRLSIVIPKGDLNPSKKIWRNLTQLGRGLQMSTETLVIIVVLLVLFGGGGGYWFSRRR